MPNKTRKTHPKKDLREKLTVQLHMVLAGFKDMVDEKRLHKLVKKAGKLLSDGLYHKPVKKVAAKKPVVKTPVANKVAAADTVAKTAKKISKKAAKKPITKKK